MGRGRADTGWRSRAGTRAEVRRSGRKVGAGFAAPGRRSEAGLGAPPLLGDGDQEAEKEPPRPRAGAASGRVRERGSGLPRRRGVHSRGRLSR